MPIVFNFQDVSSQNKFDFGIVDNAFHFEAEIKKQKFTEVPN